MGLTAVLVTSNLCSLNFLQNLFFILQLLRLQVVILILRRPIDGTLSSTTSRSPKQL